MDKLLQAWWDQINEQFFNSELKPLRAIGWEELSGPNGIGAHGKFVPRSRCIIIDERFKPDLNALQKGDEAEQNKYGFAFGLLMHEMVHQALHEKGKPMPGQHGPSFLEEAVRIAMLVDGEIPTTRNVRRWPHLYLIEGESTPKDTSPKASET